MGCSESKETESQWRTKTEQYEANFLSTLGWKPGEYTAKYTTITKNGQPFLVRTFYFGCEDKSKKTLVLTHGFMANVVSYLGLLKMLSERYRVIAFDHLGWGLNTRIPDYFPEVGDPAAAEAWILDWWEQVINGLDDCPE